jgi:glycolate oxidase iron-sulfur subunit
LSERNHPLEAAQEEILKCPRCGQCRAVCPVFAELRDESSVSRGRIALAKAMLADGFPEDKDAEHCISECTLCMACRTNCPSGVKTDAIFLAARSELAQELGISTVKRVAFDLLAKRQAVLPGLTFAAAALQGIPFASLPENSGLRLRFPVPGIDKQHVLPKVSARPLMRRLRRQVGDGKRGRLAYFVGCYDNYFDTAAGVAAVSVLAHNGYEVEIPADQGCCAMPMLASGVREVALPLMRRNVDALLASNVKYVVAACASCGSALKHLYADIFAAEGDHEYADRAATLGARFRDFTQVLVEEGFEKPQGETHLRLTFHDPCHLARGQNVKAQPRELLRAVPGIEFVEMADADRCCGGGGSFSFSHYELAKRIGDRKTATIAATEAEIVATECPGCKLHLTDGLVRHGMPQKVKQAAEVLATAYGLGGKRP